MHTHQATLGVFHAGRSNADAFDLEGFGAARPVGAGLWNGKL